MDLSSKTSLMTLESYKYLLQKHAGEQSQKTEGVFMPPERLLCNKKL